MSEKHTLGKRASEKRASGNHMTSESVFVGFHIDRYLYHKYKSVGNQPVNIRELKLETLMDFTCTWFFTKLQTMRVVTFSK